MNHQCSSEMFTFSCFYLFTFFVSDRSNDILFNWDHMSKTVKNIILKYKNNFGILMEFLCSRNICAKGRKISTQVTQEGNHHSPDVISPRFYLLLSCQPRVKVPSCFVYKVIRDLESIDHCVLILSAG